jgi:23S rRNA (cytidine1920-2'-O)/16S rRNA (cytidine1409-2'-O)-methyltransferase
MTKRNLITPQETGKNRQRVDSLLIRLGLASSRERARDLIAAGKVLADGITVGKPSKIIHPDANLTITGSINPWVSRGGLKLAAGLEAFPVIRVAGKVAVDIGASTGGFTDVLLANGAEKVIAVDVGRGQLHERLIRDRRVVVMDGVNARHLDSAMLPATPEIVVCDASFISLKKLLPSVLALAAVDAHLIALIKPQFEVGKGFVGKGGVVRDSALQEAVVADIEAWLKTEMGWQHLGTAPSPIDGPDGNREFLIAATKGGCSRLYAPNPI